MSPREEDNNSPPDLLKVSSSTADDDNNVVVGSPPTTITLDNSNNQHHADVLKRLEEVATTSYPFPIPERKKSSTKDLPKEERLNLTSKKNLRPLFVGMVRFLIKLSLPPLTLLFILLGYYFSSSTITTTTTTEEEENNDKSSSIHIIFYALAVICLAQILLFDPFFVHWITNGMFGGLGRGGGGCDASTVKKKNGFTCQDNPRNNYIKSKIEHFATNYSPTPYLYSGDLLTLIPFLLFKGSKGGRVPYRRYWVKTPSAPAPDGNDGPKKRPTGTDQDEAVALDIVFPTNGYQPDKPTFLILHGLNGGSTEPYVLDLARKATRGGHTVAVMIARGLMKTPVKGMDSFFGARTSDVGCAVDVLLYALGGQPRSGGGSSSGDNNNQGQQQQQQRQPPIVLVGFSMGAIIAANYTAKSKDQSGLAGTISFSGTVCSEKMLLDIPSANHSIAIWQPPLAWGLKGTIVKPNMTNLVKRGVSKKLIEDEIKTVKDIDSKLVCAYHGYENIEHYYEDLSAAGRGDEDGLTRLKGVQVPLLVVHAMDDPIAIYEVTLADKIPTTDNVMLLSTKHGGHIGWPTGLFPSKNRWNFMIDIAMEYATTVVADELQKMTPK